MFEQHLAPQWRARAPRVVRKKDGSDVWVFEGAQIPNIGLNAVVGRPPEEYGMEPTSFDQLRPGTFDVHARIGDMNVNGVLAQMCFPSFPGFCGALFARQDDKQLALAMLRAYNDWHIDEWAGSHPGRFIPLSLPPIWDPKLMADEVRRVARKGCHAVSFSENPEKHGLPSLHNEHWDPFWQACNDEGAVVCIHIGSGAGMAFTSMEAPVDVMITVQPINIVTCAADLLWSRVLNFPNLRSRSPRAASAGSRTSSSAPTTSTSITISGRSRISERSFRAKSFASTSSPVSSTTRPASRIVTWSASTRSPGSATTRTPTPRGRARRRSSPRASSACPMRT
jgi:hypothetical protein